MSTPNVISQGKSTRSPHVGEERESIFLGRGRAVGEGEEHPSLSFKECKIKRRIPY